MKSRIEKKRTSSTLKLAILALLCTLLWGSAFPCVKIGYRLLGIGSKDIGSQMLFAGQRFALAGAMTLLFVFVKQRKVVFPKSNVLVSILILGVVQTTLQYIFFYVGLSRTSGIKGSILTAANSFFAIVLAHFFLKGERLDVRKIVGCAFGFLGVFLINYVPNGLGGGFRMTGEGFLLFAGLSYAIGNVYVKFFAGKENPFIITGYQLLFGGLLLVAVGMLFGGHIKTYTIASGSLLGYMALLSAVAFTVWTLLIREYRVSQVSIFGFATPIFGVVLSAVFLGEQAFSLKNAIALFCVCMGIIVVNKQKTTVSLVK